MGNQLKTALLLTVLTALIIWTGRMFGGSTGIVYAFFFALAMNLASYWFSDKIVLKMYGAREVSQNEAPEIYGIVQKLAVAAGLPVPRLYLMEADSPNAFATGRNPEHAAIAVTTGLMKLLNREEIEGVLAHELSHVLNRDILIGTIASVLAGVIMLLADMARWTAIFGGFSRDDREEGSGGLEIIALAILAPIAAMIIQMAISRSREYMADATGARIAGTPSGLASALKKLSLAAQRIPLAAHASTANLFIVNPLSAQSFATLFSTHPPLEERIKRLLGDQAVPV